MKTLGLVVLGMVAVSGIALAHPHPYVNVTGDVIVFCDLNPLAAETGIVTGIGQGGACIESGHVLPAGDGSASFTIADSILAPTSGYYCQDLDLDGTCDEASATIFCGGITVASWDSAAAVFVFGDGPIFGNPVLSACGLGVLSLTVIGEVGHS